MGILNRYNKWTFSDIISDNFGFDSDIHSIGITMLSTDEGGNINKNSCDFVYSCCLNINPRHGENLPIYDFCQLTTKYFIKIYSELSEEEYKQFKNFNITDCPEWLDSDPPDCCVPSGLPKNPGEKLKKACRELFLFYKPSDDINLRRDPNETAIKPTLQNWVNAFLNKEIDGQTMQQKLQPFIKEDAEKDWGVVYSFRDETFENDLNLHDSQKIGVLLEIPTSVKNDVAYYINSSKKKQIIFTGAPGTGKTYSVEEYVKEQVGEDTRTRSKFVQFHSSFDYTDFVEGLRPLKIGDKMQFVRMDGIFKKFCRKAVNDSANLYYFIIDEINRADLGRVFGELMYCFEKRGPKHTVETQYSNLPVYDQNGKEIENDVFEKGFYIPKNVVVIGTMNDIDRSVETFDFALRRRFDWVEINAESIMESSLNSMFDTHKIKTKMYDKLDGIREMNRIIKEKLGKGFMIGPAYFNGYDGDLQNIWDRNIEPILCEYMRGRNNTKAFINDCAKALDKELKTSFSEKDENSGSDNNSGT